MSLVKTFHKLKLSFQDPYFDGKPKALNWGGKSTNDGDGSQVLWQWENPTGTAPEKSKTVEKLTMIQENK